MAHLANARSLRVGRYFDWLHVFYVKTMYYSDFLYSFLRIRFFLIFYFFKYKHRPRLITLNWMHMFQTDKKYNIWLYLYDGYFESELLFFEEDHFDYFLEYKRHLGYKKRETLNVGNKKTLWYFMVFIFIFFWIFIGVSMFAETDDYAPKTELPPFIVYFFIFFVIVSKKMSVGINPIGRLVLNNWFDRLQFLTEEESMSTYLQHIYDVNYQKTTRNLKPKGHKYNLIKLTSRSNGVNAMRRTSKTLFLSSLYELHNEDSGLTFRDFFFCSYFWCMLRAYYGFFKEKLKFLCLLLETHLVGEFNLNFFLIGNEELSADFLAWFIAHKLNQNLSVRFVLNPIIAELKYCRFHGFLSWNEFYNRLMPKKRAAQLISYRLQFIWFYLWKVLGIINKYMFKLIYLKDAVWFTSELLLLFCWVNKLSIAKNTSLVFFKNRIIFDILFHNLKFYETHEALTKFYLSFCSNLVIGQKLMYIRVSEDLIFDVKNIELTLAFFTNVYLNVFNRSLSVLGLNLKKAYTVMYWKLNYQFHFLREIFFNKIKERLSGVLKNNELIGFKIQCLGRFSRRQRASSYWVSVGKVPLNTLSGIIDYGLYTIPLINSAATVKVWLHREVLHVYQYQLA